MQINFCDNNLCFSSLWWKPLQQSNMAILCYCSHFLLIDNSFDCWFGSSKTLLNHSILLPFWVCRTTHFEIYAHWTTPSFRVDLLWTGQSVWCLKVETVKPFKNLLSTLSSTLWKESWAFNTCLLYCPLHMTIKLWQEIIMRINLKSDCLTNKPNLLQVPCIPLQTTLTLAFL